MVCGRCICVYGVCAVCGTCICTHVFGRVKPRRTRTESLRVTRQGLGVWKSFDSSNYLFLTRMLFLKILGVYYSWKIKRTKKVPLEAGRQGQESHCGAGGQEPWLGQPTLSFGAGKVRLGGRQVEEGGDPRPLGGLLPWWHLGSLLPQGSGTL